MRPAGEETVIASFRHACLPIQRDRPPFDDNLAGVVCPGGLRTLDVPQRRGLRTACKRRESYSVGAISATGLRSVSILNSYNASAAKGSGVVGSRGSRLKDRCTFRIRIDLPTPSGLGKANRSVKSRRASPCGKPKIGSGIVM